MRTNVSKTYRAFSILNRMSLIYLVGTSGFEPLTSTVSR